MFIKFNSNTKIIIINLYFFIIKLPSSIKSYKSIRKEIFNYQEINKNNLFSYNKIGLLKIKSFYFGFILPKGNQIFLNDRKFFKIYIEFQKKQNTSNMSSSILDLKNIKIFIEKNLPGYLNDFHKIITDTCIPISAIHGDLHYKNVIFLKNKYYLIDLNFFEKKGSYFFDLINFKIFSSKYYNGNWFDIYTRHRKKFFKFIDKRYFDLFVLWKINNDLKFIDLSDFKIRKFKKNLEFFFEELI